MVLLSLKIRIGLSTASFSGAGVKIDKLKAMMFSSGNDTKVVLAKSGTDLIVHSAQQRLEANSAIKQMAFFNAKLLFNF